MRTGHRLRQDRRVKMPNTLIRARRFLFRVARYWRNFDWKEAIGGMREAEAFLQLRPADDTVLMIEPNRYHAEVLPGYCHYFRRLGFNVVLLLRRENAHSGVFARVADQERPRCYAMHPRTMKRVLRGVRSEGFAFVYITSAYWAEPYGYFGLFSKFLGRCPEGEHGCATVAHVVEHVLPDIESGEVPISRISCLSPHQSKGMTIPMINPHYFGVVSARPMAEVRVFVTVGTQFRTLASLVDAVGALERLGYSNFKVQAIGAEAVRENYPDAPARIEFLGRLPFPEMYRRVEAADFLLFLLDSDNPQHRRYLGGTTTGAYQLTLGFRKVPVIQDQFALAYRFSAANAIVYPPGQLTEGMRRALDIGADEYDRLRAGVADLRTAIDAESLSNLQHQVYSRAETRSARQVADMIEPRSEPT